MSECETTEKPWTIDDYIAFAESIPEEKWIVGEFADGFGNCCFLGHLGVRIASDMYDDFYSIHPFLMNKKLPVTMVNDGFVETYNQPTAKQRTLAYLRDLKAKESAT